MKILFENNRLVIIFLLHNVNECTEKVPVILLYPNIYMKFKKKRWNHGTWLTCCVHNCPPLSRRQHIIVNYITDFCKIPSFAWRCGKLIMVHFRKCHGFHDSIIGQHSVRNFMTTISNPKVKPRFHDYYRDHLFNFLLYNSSLLVFFNTHWSNSLNHSESS